MAHYAVGAAGLHLMGLRRRKLALVALWGAVPDLDALPAVAWTLSAPHLPLGADALRTGARLLGHRGFSHTLLAALLATVLVWAVTRDHEHAIAAGLAWSLHVGLDTITEWTTTPFWPISEATYRFPLVTTLDPLLTLFALLAIAALLGPPLVDRLDRFDETQSARVREWGHRWGDRFVYASVAAVAFSAATVGWVSIASEDPTALAAHAPRTVTLDAPVEAEAEAWTATTRWVPPTEGQARSIPYALNATAAPNGTIATAECALDAMGPFAPIDHPIWELREDERGRWIATAQDLVRNATRGGGPAVHVAIADGRLAEAWVADGDAEEPRLRSSIPARVLEDARCP
jgi:membrane-bound metal-dependent hydrolase YbcI (DUF457 family)